MPFSNFPVMPVDIVREGPLGLSAHPHVQLPPNPAQRQPLDAESGVRAHRDLLLETMRLERQYHYKDMKRLRSERDRLIQDVADLEATCDYWTKTWSECQKRLNEVEIERLNLLRIVKDIPHNVRCPFLDLVIPLTVWAAQQLPCIHVRGHRGFTTARILIV
jgi:hypothetical protein